LPEIFDGKSERAEQMKVQTIFAIGICDIEAVSTRIHGKGSLGAKLRAEVIADILLSIKERRA
jgi:hypothetical protein